MLGQCASGLRRFAWCVSCATASSSSASCMSGATCGHLPASCEAASHGQASCSRSTSTPGYGFTAIIIAFLGRLNPIGDPDCRRSSWRLSYLGGEMAATSDAGRLPDKIDPRCFRASCCSSSWRCDTLIQLSREVPAYLSAAFTAAASGVTDHGWNSGRSSSSQSLTASTPCPSCWQPSGETGGGALGRAQSRRRGHDGRWAQSAVSAPPSSSRIETGCRHPRGFIAAGAALSGALSRTSVCTADAGVPCQPGRHGTCA